MIDIDVLSKPYYIVIFFLLFFSCQQKKESHISYFPNSTKETTTHSNTIQSLDADRIKRKAILATLDSLHTETLPDTSKIRKLSALAFKANSIKDSSLFKALNKEVIGLSSKVGDTFGLADGSWNYGTYYIEREVYDSAYYYYKNAQSYFKSIGNVYYSSKMLYNMAYIRGRLKDYTGSEILNIEAISLLKSLDKPALLFEAYKHLAVIYKELEEFDRALFYNEKALEQINYLKEPGTHYEGCLNNIGLVYVKQKKYEAAKDYFDKALANRNLAKENLQLYARIIDNRAYCKLKMNTMEGVLLELNQSLRIRDSLNNYSGIAINKIHLAEYYTAVADTLHSIRLLKEAADIALEIKNNRDYMASLQLLSVLDKNNATDYLKKILYLSDSLQREERQIRNKFTRIDFETDEYIYDTMRLKQQKIWILAISLGIISILVLLYFLLRQYSKNKVLYYENQQQINNEKIYFLTLNQQTKVEEGRIQERSRISEELHDGILNRLLGTRLNLGFFNFPHQTDEDIKYRAYLRELKEIEKEIRTISHNLKNEAWANASGYENLLRKLIVENAKIGKFDYDFTYNEIMDKKGNNSTLRVNLYRIIQESLQNILKFANASHVRLAFFAEEGAIKLSIEDNGKGFQANKVKEGIGLKNIRTRVKRLNGVLEIKSIQNVGTTLRISIPIT